MLFPSEQGLRGEEVWAPIYHSMADATELDSVLLTVDVEALWSKLGACGSLAVTIDVSDLPEVDELATAIW